jgi:thiol-disulfide isomerase/thioredoxin
MMKKIFSILVILLLSVSLISGCVKEDNEQTDKSETTNKEEKDIEKNTGKNENDEGETKGDAEIREGIFVGNKAYDFLLLDREGNDISLSSLKGKVVFLNFWASWCGPCKMEMPHMQKVYEEYKDKDVVILAVNITASEKNGIEGVNNFLNENKYTFPVLYDKDGSVSEKYRISAIPTTYIINRDGIIVNFVRRSMSEEMIKQQIEAGMK